MTVVNNNENFNAWIRDTQEGNVLYRISYSDDNGLDEEVRRFGASQLRMALADRYLLPRSKGIASDECN